MSWMIPSKSHASSWCIMMFFIWLWSSRDATDGSTKHSRALESPSVPSFFGNRQWIFAHLIFRYFGFHHIIYNVQHHSSNRPTCSYPTFHGILWWSSKLLAKLRPSWDKAVESFVPVSIDYIDSKPHIGLCNSLLALWVFTMPVGQTEDTWYKKHRVTFGACIHRTETQFACVKSMIFPFCIRLMV